MRRALMLQTAAAQDGFDWAETRHLFVKLTEEAGELLAEMDAAAPEASRLEDELGDVLFVCVNLAQRLALDPERALEAANDKFTRRFDYVKALAAAESVPLSARSSEQLDTLWQEAKRMVG